MNNNQKKKQNANKGYITAIAVLSVVLIALVVYILMPMGVKAPSTENNSSQSSTDNTGGSTTAANDSEDVTDDNFLDKIDTSDSKNVNVEMTDGGKFTITVYPHVAPETVENFLTLVKSGFYDGLTFHRVIDGFMAQGGDPKGDGTGGSDKTIKGEFSSNGFENNLSHRRGVVSMARSQNPDSASSQFFICYAASPHLDGDYAAFGYVTSGMETVDSFLSDGTDSNDRPNKEVKIKSMTVEE